MGGPLDCLLVGCSKGLVLLGQLVRLLVEALRSRLISLLGALLSGRHPAVQLVALLPHFRQGRSNRLARPGPLRTLF